MDNLKKFLHAKKEELNHRDPPPEAWEFISNGITGNQKAKLKQYTYLRIAACIILLAGIGAGYLSILRSRNKEIVIGSNQHPGIYSVTEKNPILPPHINTKPDSAKYIHAGNNKSVASRSIIKKTIPQKKHQQVILPVEQMQASYTALIDYQKKELKQLPIYTEKAEYFAEYKKQFMDLEAEESLMKSKLQSQERKDFVFDRLIDIYQQKITLLRQISNEIKKMNQYHLPTGTSNIKPSFIQL